LRIPDSLSRLDTVQRTSFRNSSFSLTKLFATPPGLRKPSESISQLPSRGATASDTVVSCTSIG